MPEQVNAWWLIGSNLLSLLGGAFSIGWITRGFRKDFQAVAKDATDAVALARSIKDVDMLNLRQDHSDLVTAVGIQGEKLNAIAEDHEQMKDLIMLQLPNQLEAAIKRATETAARAAWHRRRR